MDPTKAPGFVPPSDKEPLPLPSPAERIPKSDPIQRYVLADVGNDIDAPISYHERSQMSSEARHRSTKKKSRAGSTSSIPRISSDLQKSDSSSSGDEINDDKITNISPDNNDMTNKANTSVPHKSSATSYCDDAVCGSTSATSSVLSKGLKKLSVDPNYSPSSYTSDDLSGKPILGADLEEVPYGVSRQARSLEKYEFPTHRLKTKLHDNSKYPLVIVACGSFSPITYLHLRMFEMALDAIQENTKFEVIGGFYSPVSDHYKKSGLAPAVHRVRMCELACERTSNWLMVDAWETLQPTYTRTALVLDHFNEEINVKRGGIMSADGKTKRGVKIMLLAGGDLIVSMGEPNVWAENDLHHILGSYGCLIVERTGSDVRSFLLSHDILYEHRKNVLVIKQLIYNDISSTKVRLFIRRGMSVQYLLPNSVIRYIHEHKLYFNTTEPVKQVMGNND
ncbi:nicotinamide-nucleotide adenylyltransferase [Saccharomycopsis crataegensis]|uniref:Nicotinamide-nucleotide adenylyltransferase n=1 Tax=Saccharomycopsis crataegensis TaxID=43959 RepID=A0AAV5QQE9_9ASCO|nr:nicotinamide-nucleotide adenylyltransferase [Saccharomycopsis crataegensis]